MIKRMISQQALKSGQVIKSNHDGSHEFVSNLASISAIRK
jgi:hypothetical protein